MNPFETNLGPFTFDGCLMNASGVHCYDKHELEALKRSQATTYVSKSATRHFREGNPSPRCVEVPLGSINSMGLPNKGFEYYLDHFIETQNNTTHNVPFMSVAGLSIEENIEIMKTIQASALTSPVELNLSCPNVVGKPQVGYDFNAVQRILDEVHSFYTKPLGLKLPPYFDFAHFDQMADILNRYPLLFVTCINSIGNALYIDIDSEAVVIKPKNGFGGLGGEYVKPTALANVRAFRNRLRTDIAVIGCGGVISGQDVFEHILCGAQLVQVGTQLLKEGPEVFSRLNQELLTLMRDKGYTTLQEFCGKLKNIE